MKTKGILEKKDNTLENKTNLSRTLILGLVGLILVLIPDTLNKLIGIIVGVALLLNGLITIYKYMQNKDSNLNLISGILYSVLGAIIMLYPHSVLNLAAICLGVYLLITAVIKLQVAINLKNLSRQWIGTLIVAILILILGLSLIFNPFSGIAVTKLAGSFLIVVAVFDIIDAYILQKR